MIRVLWLPIFQCLFPFVSDVIVVIVIANGLLYFFTDSISLFLEIE